MNFIKEKKINKYIVITALFLSFGYSGFYSMRGTLALFTAGMNFYVFNDVFAVIFAALIGGLIYELITMFLAKSASMRLNGRGADIQYALRFFYIPANLLAGAVKTLYFFFPYIFTYGEIFIDFLFALLFFALFLWYCCKNYFKKEERGSMKCFVAELYSVRKV